MYFKTLFGNVAKTYFFLEKGTKIVPDSDFS